MSSTVKAQIGGHFRTVYVFGAFQTWLGTNGNVRN